MSAQDTRDVVDAGGDELADLGALWRRQIELDLRVSMPAIVTAYDPATQTVTVQLGLVPVMFVEDKEVPQAPIPLPGIPVIWPGTSSAYVTTPLLPGDTGLVVFSDRCISEWLRLGAPTDPINGRTHALGDGMFFPGLRPKTDPITLPTDLTATVVEGPLVSLGRNAVEFGLLGTTLAATAATLFGVLNIVPAAADPASTAVLANANKAAILGILQAIQDAVSTKVRIE